MILTGVALVVLSVFWVAWPIDRGEPSADLRRRVEVATEQLSAYDKKFFDAKLRGIDPHPKPQQYLDLADRRDALLAEVEYAKSRPGRVAKRIQYAGVAMMAIGVVAFFLPKLRRRSST